MYKHSIGIFKRLLAGALTATLLFSTLSIPVTAKAEEATMQTSVHSDDYNVKGTNSLGNLLTDALNAEQTEDATGGIYELAIADKVATVEFQTPLNATLLVAVYDETTEQMLGSGKTAVTTTDTRTTVKIQISEMPVHFLVKAFLLDASLNAIFDAYTCVDYTQAYTEFQAQTTEDFPEEQVINLDEDKANNFMVLKDSAITAENGNTENILISADEEQGVYTFENANSEITNLKPGDIFYYNNTENAEKLVVIKVKTVTVNGTTTVITSDETDLQELFDYIKVDSTGDTADFTVDEDSGDESITYLGDATYEENQPQTRSARVGGGAEIELAKDFTVKYPKENYDEAPLKINGGLKFKLKGEFEINLSTALEYYEIDLKLDTTVKVSIEVEGKGTPKIKLPTFFFSPVPGIAIEIRQYFIGEYKASIEVGAEIKIPLGIALDSENGYRNKCKSPQTGFTLEVEGSMFVGFELEPALSFIDEKVLDLSLTGRAGLNLKASYKKSTVSDPKEGCACQNCLEGEAYGEISVKASATFGKDTWLEHELSAKLFAVTTDKQYFYYSFDHSEFGLGKCPYKTGDSSGGGNGNSGSGDGNDGGNDGTSSSDYTYELLSDGTAEITDYTGNASHLTIPSKIDGYTVTSIGDCAFFWCSALTSITIPNSVTSIGDWAFFWCSALTSITIPSSVTSIGEEAFNSCSSLTSITIPSSVTTIDASAFFNCTGLTSIQVDENNLNYSSIDGNLFDKQQTILLQYAIGKENTTYIIPNSVTSIGDYAFLFCNTLTSITIPNSVTSIGWQAFSYCDNLTSITIPSSVARIDRYAFSYCDNLTIYGYSDSEAEDYARDEGVPFVALDALRMSFAVPRVASTQSAKASYTAERTISGNRYVFLSVLDTNASDLLSPDNLLYIDQKTADGDTLTFTYQNRENLNGKILVKGVFANPPSSKPASIAVTGLKVKPAKKTLAVGKKLTLKPTVTPSNATDKKLTYKSNKPSVAKVSAKGVITAKKPGKTTITVKAGSKTAKITITVVPKAPTKVKVKKASKTAVKITAKKASGAKQYQIYMRKGKKGKFKLIKTVKTPKYTKAKLKRKTTYFFKLRAVNGKYKSAYSKAVKIKL